MLDVTHVGLRGKEEEAEKAAAGLRNKGINRGDLDTDFEPLPYPYLHSIPTFHTYDPYLHNWEPVLLDQVSDKLYASRVGSNLRCEFVRTQAGYECGGGHYDIGKRHGITQIYIHVRT